MANKRGHIDLDPDYEDVTERQSKRQRVIVEDAKEATRKKIQMITAEQFDQEIYNKETEIDEADQRLHQARIMMDRLRACIVANYYGSAGQQRLSKGSANQPVAIHPTVKNVIGKRPRETTVKSEPIDQNNSAISQSQVTPLSCFLGKMNPDQSGLQNGLISQSQIKTESTSSAVVHGEARSSRFKIKKRIIVGNVSKFIPMDRREENDQPTHKWMVYVRGPQDSPDISHFVQKVWFFLHPSYRPNDLVEVSQPPFHLTRRGWGEFPLRVQLHFKDQRNKRLDIIHNLKLDRTYTGLQTLGAETVVDIELERDRSHDKPGATSTGVTVLPKQVAPSSSTKKKDAESNITIQEQASPNKIQSMPLLAEHLLGKIPTNENSNMSVQSDKENLYNENLTSDTSSKATGSVQFSGSLLGSKVSAPTTQGKSNVTLNGGLSTGASHKVSINVSASKVSTTCSQSSVSVLKSNTITITKSPSVQSAMSIKPSTQPTLILTSSIPNRCVTTGLSTLTTSVATATVTTATTRSHSNTVVTSTLSKPGTEQTLYVRCSDNQGNVFLVPHHMLKHLPGPSSAVKPSMSDKKSTVNSTTCSSTSQQTSAVISNIKSPSLIVAASSKPTTVVTSTTTKLITTPSIQHPQQTKGGPSSQTILVGAPPPGSTSKDKIILSVGGSLLGTGLSNSAIRSSSSSGQGQGQLGIGTNPVLLIKTDQPGSSPNLTLITKPQGTSVKGQQPQGALVTGQKTSTSPGLIRFQLQGNVAQPNLNVRMQGQGQQVAKSQGSLKVTSQGLKSVDQKIVNNSASNSTVGKSESATNGDKVKKNCQLASLLTGEISLTNRKPVQVVSATNRTSARSLLSPENSASLKTSATPVSGVSTQITKSQTITSSVSVLTTSTVFNNSAKITNAKSLLRPATVDSTNPVKSSNSATSSQSKTVLAKIGNQTLILQLPVSDSKALTPTSDGVKGQGHQQTVTLSLKSDKVGMEMKDPVIMNGVKENTSTVSSVPNSVKGNITQSQVKTEKVSQDSKLSKDSKFLSQDSKLSQKPPEEEKSILNLKKKRNLPPPPVIMAPKHILPIRASDFSDMASLVRAAVIRHPIVCPNIDRSQHPYCAHDTSQWLAWNPGKRRASEWQRASTCKRFLLKHIGDEFHKGTKLWTTKQIMIWCRLHAYSPHYIEKPLHPTGVDMTVAEAKVGVCFSTVTDPGQGSVSAVDTKPTPTRDPDSDTEIDIISEEPPKVKIKVEIKEEIPTDPQFVIPPDDEDVFVRKTTKKIGIELDPCDVGEDTHAPISEKLLFATMKSFARDLIQESFSLKVNQGRYPDGISVLDVYKALSSLPCADFVSNKHLGVTENKDQK